VKLTTVRPNSHRRTRVFGPIGSGVIARHRLARLWPEDGERMATAAELRALDL